MNHQSCFRAIIHDLRSVHCSQNLLLNKVCSCVKFPRITTSSETTILKRSYCQNREKEITNSLMKITSRNANVFITIIKYPTNQNWSYYLSYSGFTMWYIITIIMSLLSSSHKYIIWIRKILVVTSST